MEVFKNKDELSTCNNCLSRSKSADIVMIIGGMSIKLCTECKEKLKSLL